MRRVYCDFHIHSCLSPCGDDEMTPALAAGLLKLSGYDVAALTDHNAVGNCPAFFRACESYGLTPLAGMELTTAEDIHLVCLLRTCPEAMRFGEAVNEHRVLIRNRPKFFGNQLLMDAEDNLLGEEPNLLPNATDLSLDDAFARTALSENRHRRSMISPGDGTIVVESLATRILPFAQKPRNLLPVPLARHALEDDKPGKVVRRRPRMRTDNLPQTVPERLPCDGEIVRLRRRKDKGQETQDWDRQDSHTSSPR